MSVGSGAAPAFAGWQATPTNPAPGQLTQTAQACGQDLGSPLLSDSRGPYTASIYANSTTSNVCLSGNGGSMSSRSTSQVPASVAAGQIQANGGGTQDSAGNALTLVDGRTGAGVTAVTIDRRDGSSVVNNDDPRRQGELTRIAALALGGGPQVTPGAGVAQTFTSNPRSTSQAAAPPRIPQFVSGMSRRTIEMWSLGMPSGSRLSTIC